MPFQPGQSGNPSGRPKENAEVKALARQHAAAAIETLAAIMGDTGMPPASRVTAAQALLDRGYGKPVQEVSGPGGGAVQIAVVTGIERASE